MSGPETTDAVVEGSKVLGSGGLGAGLLFLAQRLFKKVEVDDEREAKALEAVALELKALNAGVSEIKTDVKLVMQAHAGTRADVDKLEATVSSLQLQLAELKGRFEHLTEQLAK